MECTGLSRLHICCGRRCLDLLQTTTTWNLFMQWVDWIRIYECLIKGMVSVLRQSRRSSPSKRCNPRCQVVTVGQIRMNMPRRHLFLKGMGPVVSSGCAIWLGRGCWLRRQRSCSSRRGPKLWFPGSMPPRVAGIVGHVTLLQRQRFWRIIQPAARLIWSWLLFTVIDQQAVNDSLFFIHLIVAVTCFGGSGALFGFTPRRRFQPPLPHRPWLRFSFLRWFIFMNFLFFCDTLLLLGLCLDVRRRDVPVRRFSAVIWFLSFLFFVSPPTIAAKLDSDIISLLRTVQWRRALVSLWFLAW